MSLERKPFGTNNKESPLNLPILVIFRVGTPFLIHLPFISLGYSILEVKKDEVFVFKLMLKLCL